MRLIGPREESTARGYTVRTIETTVKTNSKGKVIDEMDKIVRETPVTSLEGAFRCRASITGDLEARGKTPSTIARIADSKGDCF